MEYEDVSFKLVFLGDTLVGKTCIVNRILTDQFTDTTPTVGSLFVKHTRDIAGTEVTVNIWDTAGQERYMALTSLYYRKADVAAVVFDVNDEKTFDRASFWISEVRNNVLDCQIVLVGNKTDILEDNGQKVTFRDRIVELAKEHDCKMVFVSAKNGSGIQKLVDTVFHTFLSKEYPKLGKALEAKMNGIKPPEEPVHGPVKGDSGHAQTRQQQQQSERKREKKQRDKDDIVNMNVTVPPEKKKKC